MSYFGGISSFYIELIVYIPRVNFIKQNKDTALVDVDIKTGRKNQIRITLKDIEHPIVGDKNYGGRKAKRLYLHAYELAFRYKNKDYMFKIDMPSLFRQKEL